MVSDLRSYFGGGGISDKYCSKLVTKDRISLTGLHITYLVQKSSQSLGICGLVAQYRRSTSCRINPGCSADSQLLSVVGKSFGPDSIGSICCGLAVQLQLSHASDVCSPSSVDWRTVVTLWGQKLTAAR